MKPKTSIPYTLNNGFYERKVFTSLDGKDAKIPQWQDNPTFFRGIPKGMNVGVVLDHAGLVDVDPDSPEAAYSVPVILDAGTLSAGRGGKTRRYLYEGSASNRTYKDLGGAPLLEIRHGGKQFGDRVYVLVCSSPLWG